MISQWDEPVSEISDEARDSFIFWLSQLKLNQPRFLSKTGYHDEASADIIFTDACESGWGALHFRPDGSVRVIAHDWSSDEKAAWDLSSSVTSEPLAIRNALCMLITPSLATRAIVYTDHEPIIFAVEADCARAYAYWVLQRFLRSFPVPCSIRHIPGIDNPADAFSRGEDLTQVPDVWYALLGDALHFHQATQHQLETQGDGEYGVSQPEWLHTARNPYRSLFVSPSAIY